MRVLELEINNVRGILHLQLNPNGRKFAVWGPNGSGKSAVVDAIELVPVSAEEWFDVPSSFEEWEEIRLRNLGLMR